EVYVSASSSAPTIVSSNITIPMTATPGNTRMRVVLNETGTASNVTPCGSANYFYGETEDYMINIVQAVACTGTPDGGTTPASLTVCPNGTVSIFASGASIATGLTFQWQQSTDNGTTWVSAVGGSGATTQNYTSPAIT